VAASPESSTSTGSSVLAYEGRDGSTVLELLRAATHGNIEVVGSGDSSFVVAINGRVASDARREFWALYVNGRLAAVGAGALVTSEGDEIEWRLERY
jgi:hypothetical protein